jgi:hypothetical protein
VVLGDQGVGVVNTLFRLEFVWGCCLMLYAFRSGPMWWMVIDECLAWPRFLWVLSFTSSPRSSYYNGTPSTLPPRPCRVERFCQSNMCCLLRLC